jgi:hypothetical protein
MSNETLDQKYTTPAMLEAQRLFRNTETPSEVPEYVRLQRAVSDNRKRLRVERLARDAAQEKLSVASEIKTSNPARRWTRDDIQKLRRLAAERYDVGRIAKLLNRTPGAVTLKASKLRISLNTRS